VDRRTLDLDALLGTRTDFIYETNGSGLKGDNIIISETQDVTDIIEANKRSANDTDRHTPHGEWSKVASIPLTIYYDLKRQGITEDQTRMKKWLNDPDNKYFRTRAGRV
tara:strand:+ start:132 stop:458 length:327 start_codon:yes stop_codon:yes gene_type:complete